MAIARFAAMLALAGLVLLGLVTPMPAQTGDKFNTDYKSDPKHVAGVLQYSPRQPGVDVSKPTPDEAAKCTAKLIIGEAKGSTGWLVLDPIGRPLRRFFDSNGDSKIDMWSYFKDGVEVYREIDTNFNEKPDQFRWVNSGGSKWGIDANEDTKIDTWKQISAEEAAQEVYQAVLTKDFTRYKALLITEAELASLKLENGQAATIRTNLTKAQERFQEVCAKAKNLNTQSKFSSVESTVPQSIPANPTTGPAQDVARLPSRIITYHGPDNKGEWFNCGEMYLVGQAWRIAEGPNLSDMVTSGPSAPDSPFPALTEAAKKLVERLQALDGRAPQIPMPGKHPEVVKHMTERVSILEQLVKEIPPQDAKGREVYVRQVLDNLCTAHQCNHPDPSLLTRITIYKNEIVKTAPGSSLAGYAHYRELWGRFGYDLSHIGDLKEPAKVQQAWTDELSKFVALYPKAEDAPDALIQLAVNAEYGGPAAQDEAKKYYRQLATNFKEHPLAPKADGAVTRLELNGKPMKLSGPTIQGQAFDITKLAGKVVVVYYWASSSSVCIGDFARMKQMQAANPGKVEIVTVSLDETVAAAQKFLTANQLPAHHLFQATGNQTGLESPLATQYGIVGLPTIMLIGKDGRVINRGIQINDLEDAIKKAL